VGFELSFSTPLDIGAAETVGNYKVVQPGRTRRSRPVVVHVRAAQYDAETNTVTLTLGKFNAGKPLTLTALGLVGVTGAAASPIVTKL
jgi:hypothetical protein